MVKPKRPLSAFFHFLQEIRPKVMAANPDQKLTDIAMTTAIMWKELNLEEKQKYMNLMKEDKERYQKEKEEYEAKYKPLPH